MIKVLIALVVLKNIEHINANAWLAFIKGLSDGTSEVQGSLLHSLCMLLHINYITDEMWQEVKAFFQSSTCEDKEIVETIVKSFETENILFDPHTATAIKGNKDLNLDPSELVTFATAHPAKFPDAINKELDILDENTPSSLKEIMTKEETFSVLENNFEDLNNYLNSEVLN